MAMFFAEAAFAAEFVDPAQDAALNIHFLEEGAPLEGFPFSIYRIADMDEYGALAPNAAFAEYIKEDLNKLDQEGWKALAGSLKAQAVLNKLVPEASGIKTDANGDIGFTVKPGAYLVVGEYTLKDYYYYDITPFIAVLPGLEDGLNLRDYSVDVYPKFEKEREVQSITVQKIWKDEGFESLRPKEIKVYLLCDKEVYETVKLCKDNNWRYERDLETGHDWQIAEENLKGYVTSYDKQNDILIVTNKFISPITAGDPPIQKKVLGNPKEDAEFTFAMEGEKPENPMPEGSRDGVKEATVKGAGSIEFGEMTFTEAGTYSYIVYEKPGNDKNYKYDANTYRIIFTVTEENGELKASFVITDGAGAEKEIAEFVNTYSEPELPYTGVLWWPVPVLFAAGAVLVAIGAVKKKKHNS